MTLAATLGRLPSTPPGRVSSMRLRSSRTLVDCRPLLWNIALECCHITDTRRVRSALATQTPSRQPRPRVAAAYTPHFCVGPTSASQAQAAIDTLFADIREIFHAVLQQTQRRNAQLNVCRNIDFCLTCGVTGPARKRSKLRRAGLATTSIPDAEVNRFATRSSVPQYFRGQGRLP